LAHGEPTNGIAGGIHADEHLRRAPPQIVLDAALDNAEQRLSRLREAAIQILRECHLATLGPAQRKLHRARRLGMSRRQLDALVELHLDVRTEQTLDLD